MLEFTPVIAPLITIADKLGILQAVRGKLTRQPNPAAEELATVLEEIAKVYEAILSELSRYLSVAFYEGQPLEQLMLQRTELVQLENSAIVARIGNARGSCKKIMNIYFSFLRPWFSEVLSADETQMLHTLFVSLDEFDGVMLASIDGFAGWLAQQATETLNLVDDENLEEARRRILHARKDAAAPRKAMLDAIRTLYDLQTEFIVVSGAV